MADPKPLKYVDPATVDPDYEGVAQPVTIYGLSTGGSDVTLPIDASDVTTTGVNGWEEGTVNELLGSLVQSESNIYLQLGGKAATEHTHAAADITSGTFTVARIPDLGINKITGLEARLAAIEAQLGGG